MKPITNIHGLPEPLVRAVSNDSYTKGDADWSITQLIKPPRIVILEKQFKDQIVEDASDRIWSLIGQIGHSILERAAMKELSEQTLTMTVLGKKIKGQIDLLNKGENGFEILDYKLTSAWSCKDGPKIEWLSQLNLYRLLCSENDITVSSMKIVAIYRDWSVLEAKRNQDYPRSQVQVFEIPMWDLAYTDKFACERVQALIDAETTLPLCTDEDTWAKPEKFALMKKGGVRAIKLFDTRASAESAMSDPKNQFIEHRPAEYTRCNAYCACEPFCLQAQARKGKVA